jgi:SNF2 family DNA or RNA helicase
VENRLGDLWSIFDFLNPGLLGSAPAFAASARLGAERPGYAPLRRLVQPYILRRLKTDKHVIADLPDKTEVGLLPAEQAPGRAVPAGGRRAAERLETLDGMERRGVVLAFLMRFKQICNHPSQWLGRRRLRAG